MLKNSQRRFKLAAIALASASTVLVLGGCGASDSVAPLQVPTTPPVQALASLAKYQLVIRNAATGALVTDSTTVSFAGANIVNLSGAAITGLTVTDGLGSFATAPGVTAGARLTVATLSRAAGWSDGSASVDVVANNSVQVITISVNNTNSAAAVSAINASTAPVVAATAAAPVTGNVVTTVVTSTTPSKTATSVFNIPALIVPAVVSIPTNTRISNAAGQTPTGVVTLAVSAGSIATVAGQNAVPGGFVDPDGDPLEIAGLVTTTLQDANGNRFTNFSAPVTVQTPITPGTQNFEGTGPLVAGDAYPISVWNETTRQWEYSATGIIKAVNGGLVAEFTTTSFSRRALVRASLTAKMSGLPERFRIARDRTRCTMSLNFTGRPAGNTDAVTVVARSRSRSAYFDAVTGNTAAPRRPNNWIDPGAAGDQAARIVAVRDSDFTELANFVSPNGCGVQQVALAFPAPPTGSIVVSTTEACADTTGSRPVPTNVSAVTGTAVPRTGYTTGGTVTLTALPAGTYSVKATGTGGRADITQSVAVGAGAVNANFVFPLNCVPATGGG